MIFYREISNELLELAKDYPVITIIGPRQSGKTTLVKSVFPNKSYANLELPDIREFARLDPRGFLAQYPNGAILDEIQRTPQLLSYIQADVDENKEYGKYILTVSHQLELHEAISQSLAGRTAILNLLPMTINELSLATINLSLNEYIYNGFFPQIHIKRLNPTKAYRNYFHTYVEKDVRQIINIKDLNLFQKFVSLCAGRVGQVLNKESLGNDVGVSAQTITSWLSILEASFIIFLLPPYFENFGKRVIKSPKLYFTDVGLATYLLKIEDVKQLERDPLRGFLVENLVILELMKTRFNKGLDHNLYYYRDNHGNEVDIIYKKSNDLLPIEIKASQTFNSDFLKGLMFFKDLVGIRADKQYLIYGGEYEQKINDISVINFRSCANIVG